MQLKDFSKKYVIKNYNKLEKVNVSRTLFYQQDLN